MLTCVHLDSLVGCCVFVPNNNKNGLFSEVKTLIAMQVLYIAQYHLVISNFSRLTGVAWAQIFALDGLLLHHINQGYCVCFSAINSWRFTFMLLRDIADQVAVLVLSRCDHFLKYTLQSKVCSIFKSFCESYHTREVVRAPSKDHIHQVTNTESTFGPSIMNLEGKYLKIRLNVQWILNGIG